MADKIVVRVQSREGTKRVETSKSESTDKFLEKVCDKFRLLIGQFHLYTDRKKSIEIVQTRKPLFATYKIRHGDMLLLEPVGELVGASNSEPVDSRFIVEDDIDVFLNKQSGVIERSPDPKYCQHNKREKCIHCTPLDPWDEGYLREQNIRHMSFHSYIRKLTCGVSKGKFAMLENISCKIKSGCMGHPPWPEGICTKCQPNAVTLNRQLYRHVDNISFENGDIVDKFLDFWRKSGQQRMGFLFGRYEHHKDVPLGIKATVVAIYEPPQVNAVNGVELLEDDKAEVIDNSAAELGLKRVGWIFTDLVTENARAGTVKHFRNMNTYFLSAEEVIMAGSFQNQYPNPCKLSPDGHFGSKFVTVVISGDKDNQIHMEGYQVSNQCMALVKDECLVPTKDAPELGYIKESTNQQYVPDVFYKEKDVYSNEVTQLARPLPIEYLLIDVPVASPMTPQYMFLPPSDQIQAFPIENRLALAEIQDFAALSSYMRQFSEDRFLDAVSNFHLLSFLATADMLPLGECMRPLLIAVKNKDADAARDWYKGEEWSTVEQLMKAENSPLPHENVHNELLPSGSLWQCKHCTFLNQPNRVNCEICGLPK